MREKGFTLNYNVTLSEAKGIGAVGTISGTQPHPEILRHPDFIWIPQNDSRGKTGKVMKEKGFTLIEMLVALAVGSVILTGAVGSIYQILVTTGRGSSQTVALNDINRAALAIKNDLLMAQTTDLVDGVPKSSANLTWIDYTSSFGTSFLTPHSSAYTLSGKQLRRNYNGAVSIIGRNVTSISFTQTGKAVTVVISSSSTTPPSGIETLKFSVHLRSEEVE